MEDTESGSSSASTFFDSLGSVDQDLLFQVLGDTADAASENGLRPLRFIDHQLRKEIDRERRRCDILRGQLRAVDRVLKKLGHGGEAAEESAEKLFLTTLLHSRAEDLQLRLSESTLQEKETRRERLRRTLGGVLVRAKVARALMKLKRPEEAESMANGTGPTLP